MLGACSKISPMLALLDEWMDRQTKEK